MKYDAILFDMDGTTLDTLSDLCAAVNHSLSAFGLPQRSAAEIRSFLGNGARRLMRCAAPETCDGEAFEELLRFYIDYYNDHSLIKTAPYEGICPLLEELQRAGCTVAIISNKPDQTVRVLGDMFFPGIFAVGEKPGIARKPAPDAVFSCLEHFGTPKEQAVYIGDSEVDLMTARNAGIDCIAVSWGFRDREDLERNGAVQIADTPDDLRRMLQ